MDKVYFVVMRGRSKSDPHVILKDVVCVFKTLKRAKRALIECQFAPNRSSLLDFYYSIEMHYVY